MSSEQTANWSRLSIDDVAREFDTDVAFGLTRDAAARRLHTYGKNELTGAVKGTLVGRVAKQFKSPLVFILLAAGIATLALAEYLDTIVIFIALAINVALGTVQEERASRAFEKLRGSQTKNAEVIRGGKKQLIPAAEVVPGDMVVLESGYEVPADIRLVETKHLQMNESVLTGEWAAVGKNTETLTQDASITGRHNMAWKGTLIESGFGRGIAVATGQDTQIGDIAESLTAIDDTPTPIQRNIKDIARVLVWVIAAAIAIIFVLGVWRGEGIGEMLLISIAVAVAAMPEGLPAAVTVVLALGMEAILKRGGLVRNLVAAETLGSTTFILTDKTGTLTQAHMKLDALHTASTLDGAPVDGDQPDVRYLLESAVLGSNAFVEEAADAPRKLTVHGDPIEKAIVLGGLEAGISQEVLAHNYDKLDFLQFESDRQFSATLLSCTDNRYNRLVLPGAPEKLLAHAQYVLVDGKREKLTDELRESFLQKQEQLSSQGKRLIALSYRDTTADTLEDIGDNDELLEKSIFAGLLVFSDPVRDDVGKAIKTVQGAGARVVMVTGDNPATALNVAQQTGVAARDDRRVFTGDDIEKMDDAALVRALGTTSVFARILPKQKLRLANVLKGRGEVVAMTGDGVNDAPALQRADIGVAIGTGTEVAKEASDIVLLNNSFAIITYAIEEGRKIIDNLRKVVAYLLSTGFSEIVVIGGALAVGAPLPLLPTQILWTNIVEEGFMSFSFAFEKKEPGIMKRSPRSHRAKTVLTSEIKKLIAIIGLVTGAFLLALYFFLLSLNLPIEEIRTFMFVALGIDSIFFVFSIKNLHRPLWHINPFTNLYLLGAFVISTSLLVAAVLVPPLQTLLSVVPLSPIEWTAMVGVGLFNLALIEAVKYALFMRAGRAETA